MAKKVTKKVTKKETKKEKIDKSKSLSRLSKTTVLKYMRILKMVNFQNFQFQTVPLVISFMIKN